MAIFRDATLPGSVGCCFRMSCFCPSKKRQDLCRSKRSGRCECLHHPLMRLHNLLKKSKCSESTTEHRGLKYCSYFFYYLSFSVKFPEQINKFIICMRQFDKEFSCTVFDNYGHYYNKQHRLLSCRFNRNATLFNSKWESFQIEDLDI